MESARRKLTPIEILLRIALALVLSAILWGVLFLTGIHALVWILDLDSPDPTRPVPNPIGRFEEETGLSCPPSIQPIFVEDTHGGFHFDGDLTIGLGGEKATIDEWLKKAPPPLSADEWRRGPIPPECGRYFSREPGQSPDVWYVAKDRNFDGKWTNGTLLILDPKTGEAWLFVWDT